MKAMTVLCALSLLGNLWLYRELKVANRAEPRDLVSSQPPAQGVVPAITAVAAAQTAIAPADSARRKQTLEKCRKKFEGEMLRQFRDPKEREAMKRQDMLALQAMNVGAATRLNVSEQVMGRIFELQAEQDLIEREAAIGRPRLPKGETINPQIANEFGEAIATKWADYSREFSGRIAVQTVANLFAEANVALTEEQRRRLVGIYADEFEMQNAQGSGEDYQEMQDAIGDQRAMSGWFEKQAAHKQAFDQRILGDAASFLTPVQLELLRKKSDMEAERSRTFMESMQKNEGIAPPPPPPEVEC